MNTKCVPDLIPCVILNMNISKFLLCTAEGMVNTLEPTLGNNVRFQGFYCMY